MMWMSLTSPLVVSTASKQPCPKYRVFLLTRGKWAAHLFGVMIAFALLSPTLSLVLTSLHWQEE